MSKPIDRVEIISGSHVSGLMGATPLPVVSAWASHPRFVLGQQVTAQSNEIIAIPLLRDPLEPTGVLVTIDAMVCQRGIASAVCAKGADYLLALKDTQPSRADEVRAFFDQP